MHKAIAIFLTIYWAVSVTSFSGEPTNVKVVRFFDRDGRLRETIECLVTKQGRMVRHGRSVEHSAYSTTIRIFKNGEMISMESNGHEYWHIPVESPPKERTKAGKKKD